MCELLRTDVAAGLTQDEAAKRLREVGPNAVQVSSGPSRWQVLLRQFKSRVVLLLVAAAAVAFAFGEHLDGAAVLAVILVNAGIGYGTERRAQGSVDALRALGSPSSIVRRGGQVQTVPAETLVPGDIVLLDAGDVPAADVRVFEAADLMVDESALTGESVAVSKDKAACKERTALSDRTCILHKGTSIANGSAVGIVVGTGMRTAIGEITGLVSATQKGESPLQARLDVLAQKLIVLTVAIATAVTVSLLMRGRDPFLAIEIGIALAVAAIPEGLTIVATIALARGMAKMARRNALVENLTAVETLGSTSVLLTDKTGTLTENRMSAAEYQLCTGAIAPESISETGRRTPCLDAALRIGVLCSNARSGRVRVWRTAQRATPPRSRSWSRVRAPGSGARSSYGRPRRCARSRSTPRPR